MGLTDDSIFWLTMATLILGSFGLSLKYCLKSRCDTVKICGIIAIHRNSDLESKEEEQHPINLEQKTQL